MNITVTRVSTQIHIQDCEAALAFNYHELAKATACIDGKAISRILLPEIAAGRRHDELETGGITLDVTEINPAIRSTPEHRDPLSIETIAFEDPAVAGSGFGEIIGAAPVLRAVLSRVARVAPTDTSVLITGETGTGKELIARAIHRESPRAAGPFVKVNCAAVPQALILSELFGHERGAFTGALHRKPGRFERAQGGTLFLDEIGEISNETQIALLRVLQEGEFERLGGTQPIHANVRLIAATNRNLEAEINRGAFRSDLFYRLNVFPIEMPPLRARKEDIRPLTEHFIHCCARKLGKKVLGIDRRTLEMFQSYAWPGNIRELQNIVERSLILCQSPVFFADGTWSGQGGPVHSLNRKLFADEKSMIETALAETHGRVSGPSGAADRLGIPASTLESKIRSFKINKYFFKAQEFDPTNRDHFPHQDLTAD